MLSLQAIIYIQGDKFLLAIVVEPDTSSQIASDIRIILYLSTNQQNSELIYI